MRIQRSSSFTSNVGVARAFIACSLSVGPFVALGQLSTQSSLDGPSIVAKASPAVVLIKGESAEGTVIGSGLIVSPDGKVATNLHVIRDLKAAGVQLSSGETFDVVSVLAFDDRKDLAIVKIAGFDLPTAELGNSNDVKIGERVVAIGSPHGLQGSVTTGVVSAIRDDLSGSGAKVIQTDASANPGNSGGPLLNDRGQAIGLVRYKRQGEGLNFAMPINYVRGLLDNLQKPISLDELRAILAYKTDVFTASDYPVLWKSLTASWDRQFKLRFEGEYIYGETLWNEQQRKFFFDRIEIKKESTGYKGLDRFIATCSWTTWAPFVGEESKYARCPFEFKLELTSITPSRIEGRIFSAPRDAKMDCGKCLYSKPFVWAPFIWIPQ